MNKRVIGVGVKDSTSALLPPACDEFIFYDTLEGVEVSERVAGRRRPRRDDETRPEVGRLPREPAGARRGVAQPDVDELAIVIAQTVAGLGSASRGAACWRRA